jgi:hypothetical protein
MRTCNAEAGTRDLAGDARRWIAALEQRERELSARELVLDERERARAGRGTRVGAEPRRRDDVRPAEHARRSVEREQALAERERAVDARLAQVAAREADLVRMQRALSAREEDLRRRERELENAERLRERAAVAQPVPYVSFSEGLDALAAGSDPPAWR